MFRERRTTVTVLAAFACALIALLAVPALAAAAEYEVNVLGDGSATTGCETPGPSTECTLRGAIAAANANAGKDVIKFDPNVFDGEAPEATITIGSPLVITESVEILGGGCSGGWTPLVGPCAEIAGLPSSVGGGDSIKVEADDVKIEGLAVEGGENGIDVAQGKTGFTAVGDWFGVGLNPFSGTGIFGDGIRLEPGADHATIGGTGAADRNVFKRAGFGVFIEGASGASIEGNYFGLKPDGTYQFGSSITVGVRIADSTTPSSKAEHDEVGGLREAGAKSTECDGACNVFATDGGPGVVLGSATGPTVIRGNYLGLTPDGGGSLGSRSEGGVLAAPPGAGEPGPGDVTIGGATPATEANFFVEGKYGVHAEGAENLAVLGNKFGYTSAGQSIEFGGAEEVGIGVSSQGLPAGALIEANSMSAIGSVGIESAFAGSEIVGNEIAGGQTGIFTGQPSEGVGNLVQDNTVTGSAKAGVKVENDSNILRGNTITKSGGEGIYIEGEEVHLQSESNVVTGNAITKAVVGIDVGSNSTRNRIGGDGAGEANTIVESGGTGAGDGAITIDSRQEGRTEVAANTGFGNTGAFIKLISHSPGHEEPNGGIKPPTLSVVRQSNATGTAQPNATVRIFSKASAEPGELGSLLAVVKADGAGNWSATYATLPVGTLVAATQTSEAGTAEAATSEVGTVMAAAADPVPPPPPGGTGSQITTTPPPPTKTAPKVTITKGPKKTSSSTTATFKFKASVSGSSFECKLDSSRWASCKSPKTYKKLKPGTHTFQVRAKATGLTGAAAKSKFTIKS